MIGTTQVVTKNGIPYTIRNSRQRFFFPDEWMEFYDGLTSKQKVTFNFLINTIARINEVRNIKVSDIDFERRAILLRVTKGRNKDGSQKIRIIKVSDQFLKWVRAVIKDYNLERDSYFPILSTPAANICMKKTLKKIGVKDWMMFSVHNVRKTAETWLLSLGVDSVRVAKQAGHTVAMASKHYIGEDVFSFEERKDMRLILGNLLQQERF